MSEGNLVYVLIGNLMSAYAMFSLRACWRSTLELDVVVHRLDLQI